MDCRVRSDTPGAGQALRVSGDSLREQREPAPRREAGERQAHARALFPLSPRPEECHRVTVSVSMELTWNSWDDLMRRFHFSRLDPALGTVPGTPEGGRKVSSCISGTK